MAAISRMDPDYGPSDREQMLEFCRCYQIALYLLVYLNAINSNASAPHIRSNLLELQERLSKMELLSVVSQWNCTFFNMLMVGAMASRALPERVWFAHLLADWYLEVRYLDDVWELMAQFIDPFVIVPNILEEIWHDVLATRFPKNSKTTLNLYRKDVIKLEDADQGRPFTRSPKIDGPRKILDEEI